MGTPSFNGHHPVTMRVMEVMPTGFTVQIQEWAYLDTTHTTEDCAWMVVERGAKNLVNDN